MAPGAVVAESLSFAQARARVLGAVRALPSEVTPLAECRGRALRQSVTAPHALPPFRNASMDGFAVRSADLASALPGAPVSLPVVEILAAGAVASRALGAREAMRIMTGAMIPEGADAVVAFEETEGGAESERRVRFLTSAAAGLNVREAGRDVSEGEVVLAEGRELSAHDLALAASLGVPKLSVNRRPRAIVLSTGDELLEIDAAQRPGAIRDSNRLQLALLLEEAGASVVRTARLSDDPEKVRKGIASALSAADVVLTIGGVSAGDFDPVKQSLGELPEIALWRVAMKPGRPQAFGTPEGRMFFGLPGNPASVACTFEALVRPALRKLMGFSALDRPKLSVRSHARIDSREGRVDFVRVTLERRDGEWWASEAGEQVSGHLAPQSRAHALLVVPAECTGLDAGERGDALLLRWPESA